MEKLIGVAVGGAAGALARYATVLIYQRYWNGTFPLAILSVNVLGSLLFGIVWSISEERDWISANMRLLVLTGFMGSFTTFSTFAFDGAMLIRGNGWALFAANLLLSNAMALAAVFVGFRLGKIAAQ